MQNVCIPFVEAAYTQKLTAYFTLAVTGKRFVAPLDGYQGAGPGLSADPLPANDGGALKSAGPPAAGGKVGGVAMSDVAATSFGGVIRGPRTILPVSSGAAVTKGDLLKVDNQGRVVLATTGTVIVGKAQSTVAGADLDVVVELYDIDDNNLAP